MTLSKLAQLANVSVSVVSKAFSGKDDISEAMREHVFSVAREHGCFQQFYHIPYDKPVIAVIIPEAISQYYIHYIEVLKRIMEESGYTMMLSISNFDKHLASELVNYYTLHSKVDGLILISGVEYLPNNVSTAIISFGSADKINIGTHIELDINAGMSAALKYLKDNGHKKISYIGEEFTRAKEEILKEELKKAGLECRNEWMITSRSRFEDAGRDGVRQLLSLSERPTAIFGAYGYITQGILKELAANGLGTPRDISVISMDSDPYPLDTSIDISCIMSSTEERCKKAMEILAQRIRTDTPNASHRIILPALFHEGETVQNITK